MYYQDEGFKDLIEMYDFLKKELDKSDGEGKFYHQDEEIRKRYIGQRHAIQNEMYRRIDALPIENIDISDPPRGDWK